MNHLVGYFVTMANGINGNPIKTQRATCSKLPLKIWKQVFLWEMSKDNYRKWGQLQNTKGLWGEWIVEKGQRLCKIGKSFSGLRKWYQYKTNNISKSLQNTSKLYQSFLSLNIPFSRWWTATAVSNTFISAKGLFKLNDFQENMSRFLGKKTIARSWKRFSGRT